jgi:hypothetical protein
VKVGPKPTGASAKAITSGQAARRSAMRRRPCGAARSRAPTGQTTSFHWNNDEQAEPRKLANNGNLPRLQRRRNTREAGCPPSKSDEHDHQRAAAICGNNDPDPASGPNTCRRR